MKRFLAILLTLVGSLHLVLPNQSTFAADGCTTGIRPDGLHTVYQRRNQSLVMMNDKREVVTVIEDGLITGEYKDVNYSPNCRYLVGGVRTTGDLFNTIVWDLESNPVSRVIVFENAYIDAHKVSWSGDSNYAVVSGREWVDLLRLGDANRVRLTNKIISDCSISVVGCRGDLDGYEVLYWHPELNQLHMMLTDDNFAIIDLSSGQPIDFWNNKGEPLPAHEANVLREQMASPYGCTPKVQYQTYNQRLVLKSYITSELVDVIESNLVLKQYDLIGWSPNCNYIAANIDEGNGLVTVVWNTRNNSRAMTLPYSRENRSTFDWTSLSG